MSGRPGDCEKSDWPEYRLHLLKTVESLEKRVDGLEISVDGLTKRTDDAHNEVRWLREKIVFVTSGVGTLIGILWGLISDNWEKLFK